MDKERLKLIVRNLKQLVDALESEVHSDITEAIQVELDKIARYHDQVEVIDQYFK